MQANAGIASTSDQETEQAATPSKSIANLEPGHGGEPANQTMTESSTVDTDDPVTSPDLLTGGGCSDDFEDGVVETITSSIPPTEIIDTVVTVTRTPDGGLKRTMRKTTRTLVTTTTVRRIRTQAPVGGKLEPVDEDLPGDARADAVALFKSGGGTVSSSGSPMVYTLVSPVLKDEDEESRITQTSFAFMPPTSKTEIQTYVEEGGGRSDLLEAGELGEERRTAKSDGDPSRGVTTTKRTVKKTVTTSAARATFVSAGKKSGPLVSSPNSGSMDESELMPDVIDPLSQITEQDQNSGESTGPANQKNVVSSRATRVVNCLTNKGLLLTRTSLDSLRKPFSAFGKDVTKTDGSQKNAKNLDSETAALDLNTEDTERLALIAMHESERLFSEAQLLPMGQPGGEGYTSLEVDSLDNSGQDRISGSNSDMIVMHMKSDGEQMPGMSFERLSSRFTNLPLYQGYGLIAQQLNQCLKDQNRWRSVSPGGYDYGSEEDKTPTNVLPLNWLSGSVSEGGQEGFPGSQAGDQDLLTLFDESTAKFFREAAAQLSSVTMSWAHLESDISAGQVESLANESVSTHKAKASSEEETSVREVQPLVELTSKEDAVSQETLISDGATDIPANRKAGTPQEGTAVRPALSQLGISRQGAFRVAWSDMPEVRNGDALQKLTRHEIQLQEAMFEVITSEASYYQSLNVLVNHFYRSPEFGCDHPSSSQVLTTVKISLGNGQLLNASNGSGASPQSVATGRPPQAGKSRVSANLSSTPPTSDGEPFPGALESTHSQSTGNGTKRHRLKPLEKHHLFSNVLLVCLASEKFLWDLEIRWASQMPILNEVCDLVLKHAGGVNFEPYVTYLRNQAYQMATLRKLCKRDSFRTALDVLHAHPVSGKNTLSSFLALPMQRLTRLKLLVQVIQRLQDTIVRDMANACESSKTPPPYRVPTDRERETAQLALHELDRLLASSETEKELMDQKARLLTLSTSLEFPDNVKSLAISDKRIIHEGELREATVDGRMTMLQKLSLKKPNFYYLILFNDLLLITKRKKNDRYLVLDYCERASVQVSLECLSDRSSKSTEDPGKNSSLEDVYNAAPLPPPPLPTSLRCSRHESQAEFDKLRLSPGKLARPLSAGRTRSNLRATRSPQPSPGNSNHLAVDDATATAVAAAGQQQPTEPLLVANGRQLARSGSSVSRFQLERQGNARQPWATSPTSASGPGFASVASRAFHLLRLVMSASHNGTVTELRLCPKDLEEHSRWCQAFAIPLPRDSQESPAIVESPSPIPTDATVCRDSGDGKSKRQAEDGPPSDSDCAAHHQISQ